MRVSCTLIFLFIILVNCTIICLLDISKYYSGNTCLIHGLTVHTSYTVSHPYPRLEPSVSLKYDDHIVLNTCNFIHVLNIGLDKNIKVETDVSDNINVPLTHKYILLNTTSTFVHLVNIYLNLQA